MRGLFPALTTLKRRSGDILIFFPDPFLARSQVAQYLPSLNLDSVPFFAVRRFLLSAGELVALSLWSLSTLRMWHPGQ
jgi:hypothetical protein